MSHTFYESPDDASPYEGKQRILSIDVTHHWCWFFEHNEDGDVTECVRVAKDELPAIYEAIGRYLEASQV